MQVMFTEKEFTFVVPCTTRRDLTFKEYSIKPVVEMVRKPENPSMSLHSCFKVSKFENCLFVPMN